MCTDVREVSLLSPFNSLNHIWYIRPLAYLSSSSFLCWSYQNEYGYQCGLSQTNKNHFSNWTPNFLYYRQTSIIARFLALVTTMVTMVDHGNHRSNDRGNDRSNHRGNDRSNHRGYYDHYYNVNARFFIYCPEFCHIWWLLDVKWIKYYWEP